MLSFQGLLIVALFALLILVLVVVGLAKLFLIFKKPQRIALACIIVGFVSIIVAWFCPIGTLTGSTWQLSNGFRANPRHIQPAPLSIQFFDDGTATKINHDGYVQDFEWHLTVFDELSINTRWGSYIVRFRGFGTRLSLEDSLRGERSMGRFDTRSDFTVHFRRSFWH